MIEFRGLGLKRDTPDEQAQRVRDHNTIWGPFGRNLHEDFFGRHRPGARHAAGTRRRGASCTAGAKRTQSTTKSACGTTIASGRGGWGDRRPTRSHGALVGRRIARLFRLVR